MALSTDTGSVICTLHLDPGALFSLSAFLFFFLVQNPL